MKDKLLHELSWRGLLNNIANEENLDEIISSKSSFYVGIDPTSDSLHIGHYMVISLARTLHQYGLTPVFVIGGFTGSIGDPSGKHAERKPISEEIIDANSIKLKKQITELANKAGLTNFIIWNNKDLYKDMSIVELFQTYGKLFNLNSMLSKDIVKTRIETGISFTEFSYQIFQAIDYLHLFQNNNVKLQIAGQDQWSNIVTGLELIRKIEGPDVKAAGITVNLITDAHGNKIGKTEGKPIWLDNSKTSEYEFYQYIFNLTDELAEVLLRTLTSITEEDLTRVANIHITNPSDRVIQKELADRLMLVIYENDSFSNAYNTSMIVFKEKYSELSAQEALDVFGELPIIEYSENLIDSAINSNVIASKREYRDLIKVGAVKVNGESVEEGKKIIDGDYIDNKFIIINLGKKKKFIIWK